MSGDAQLMLMIAGMHLLGLVCAAVLIIPALRDSPEFPPHRPDPGSDDGWGRGPEGPPKPPDPPRGGIPQLDAEPAYRVPLPTYPDALHDRQRPAGVPGHPSGPERAGDREAGRGLELDDRDSSRAPQRRGVQTGPAPAGRAGPAGDDVGDD